jgi:hypothetical protein
VNEERFAKHRGCVMAICSIKRIGKSRSNILHIVLERVAVMFNLMQS